MELDQFLHHLNEGKSVEAGSSEHHMMMQLSQEALKMTMALNNTYHTPEENSNHHRKTNRKTN